MKIHATWRALSDDGKDRVIRDLVRLRRTDTWTDADSRAVADAINYRASTVKRARDDQLGRLLRMALPRMAPRHLGGLLTRGHLLYRQQLVGAVYDALDVPHDGLELAEDAGDVVLEADLAVRVADDLVESWPVGDLALCFATIADAGLHNWRAAAGVASDHLLARIEPAVLEPAEEGSGEPERAAELEEGQEQIPGFASVRFTTLDNVLFRAVVSSLNHVEGSLDFDELDNLVQEIVELNDSRTRSHFHRGFLDALLDRGVAPMGPGDNRERRGWYLAGNLQGWMRRESMEQVLVRLNDLDKADRSVLLDEPPVAGGARLAIHLVRPLLEHGRVEDAQRWLDRYLVVVAPQILRGVIEWARAAHLDRDPVEVSNVLEMIDQTIPQLEHRYPDIPRSMIRGIKRHLAVSWRRQARFEAARQKLDELLAEGDDLPDRSMLLFDRAMVEMGIGRIEELRIPAESERERFIKSIEQGRGYLEQAAEGPQPYAAALFALALSAFGPARSGEAEVQEAAERMAIAVKLMSHDDTPTWNRTGLLDRARFYGSVLDLRLLPESTVTPATPRIVELLRHEFECPVDILVDVIHNAALMDAPYVDEITRLTLRRYPREAIGRLEVDTLADSPAIREAVEQTVQELGDGLSADDRWDVYEKLLGVSLRAHDARFARKLLDHLELLAEESDRLARRFLDLLSDELHEALPWTDLERDQMRLYLAERLDEIPLARGILVGLVHRAMSERDEVAFDLLDWLKQLGEDHQAVGDLYERLRHAMPEAASDEPGDDGSVDSRKVRTMFIGGNETQKAYEKGLQEVIHKRFPNAHIAFHFSGWGAPRSSDFDRYERQIRIADAVVLMSFVRTQFGRWVRDRCGRYDVPWVPCTGHGFDSLKRSLLRAIRLSLERRRPGA